MGASLFWVGVGGAVGWSSGVLVDVWVGWLVSGDVVCKVGVGSNVEAALAASGGSGSWGMLQAVSSNRRIAR